MNTNRFLFRVFFSIVVHLFAIQLYAVPDCPREHCSRIRKTINSYCVKLGWSGDPYRVFGPDGKMCFCTCGLSDGEFKAIVSKIHLAMYTGEYRECLELIGTIDQDDLTTEQGAQLYVLYLKVMKYQFAGYLTYAMATGAVLVVVEMLSHPAFRIAPNGARIDYNTQFGLYLSNFLRKFS